MNATELFKDFFKTLVARDSKLFQELLREVDEQGLTPLMNFLQVITSCSAPSFPTFIRNKM